MKVKLRKGAIYGQDFAQWQWEDEDSPAFTVKYVLNGHLVCVAPGYGIHEPDQYGNGAIYVKPEHVYPDMSSLGEMSPLGADI